MFAAIRNAIFPPNHQPAGRLESAHVERLPFPHVARDGVLTGAEIKACIKHWPEPSKINEESPGYIVLHTRGKPHRNCLSASQAAYWDRFADDVCTPLAQELFDLYAPWIQRKFGSGIQTAELTTVALTEFASDAAEVGPHVHSGNPTYLFTILVYVDDGENTNPEARGTALFGFDRHTKATHYTDETCNRLARATNNLAEGMRIQRDYGFKPGRMFSFLESPLSYHGSRPPAPCRLGRRRIIRMHVMAPTEFTASAYGVSYEEFRAIKYPQVPGALDPRLVAWTRKHTRALFSPARFRRAPKVKVMPPPFWG